MIIYLQYLDNMDLLYGLFILLAGANCHQIGKSSNIYSRHVLLDK